MKKYLILLPLLSACGFEIVDTGRRGIETRFGQVVGEPLPEGLHFYNPMTTDIVEMDVREQKIEEDTTAFTLDTQNVVIKYSLTYFPQKENIHVIYREFGPDYAEKIIKQVVLGSIKDVIGQYIADDLVGKREIATQAAEKELKENLASRHITVTRLDFVNLDFDDAYEKAVEDKVVAIQRAKESVNRTVQVKEEAKQIEEKARAEANAMKIKSQALAENKGLVQFEAVQKWDGKLPVNMYGSAPIPFMNLNAR